MKNNRIQELKMETYQITGAAKPNWPIAVLSTVPFESYVKSRTIEEKTIAGRYYKMVLSEYRSAMRKLTNSTKRELVFDLIDQALFVDCNAESDLTRFYVAPLGKKLLHSCHSFISKRWGEKELKSLERGVLRHVADDEQYWEIASYQAIWNHFTVTPCPLQPEKIVHLEVNGRTCFMEISSDNRFVKAGTTLDAEECSRLLIEADEASSDPKTLLAQLRERLPLDWFTVTGFYLWHVRDITVVHLLEKIKLQADAAGRADQSFIGLSDVLAVLDIVTDHQGLYYGLYPLLRINGRCTFDDPRDNEGVYPSIFANRAQREELYHFLEEIFRLHPKAIYLKSIGKRSSKYAYLKALERRGIQTYVLLPVVFMGTLVGALEVFTDKPEALPKANLFKLEIFIPVLGSLFKNSIDRFNETIENIIKDQYTSLQPAVQWRFNEAALNFIKSGYKPDLADEISFNQVYPLYGAIDIKNSTVNRNMALKEDLLFQLNKIIEVLEQLEKSVSMPFIGEKKFLCLEWVALLETETDNAQLDDPAYFIETEMLSFFKGIEDLLPKSGTEALLMISEWNAGGCRSFACGRRKFERSMDAVIGTINRQMDLLRAESTRCFPCFFEKFRTDGVEYDIYIGGSIAPQKKFSPLFIQNLRFLQLESMIRTVNEVRNLQKVLEVPIETTQLIFVHPNFIDIRFRRDERRFDVEGAYNIRYHMIKKRIDKALVKGSGERLTAHGKIALVYFTQKDMDDFLIHIRYFQHEGDIEQEMEYLELEPMQGVAGMKAIRIGIVSRPVS